MVAVQDGEGGAAAEVYVEGEGPVRPGQPALAHHHPHPAHTAGVPAQYLYSVYTVFIHSIYTVSIHHQHNIYTQSTIFLHSIYRVSKQYLRNNSDQLFIKYLHTIYKISTQYLLPSYPLNLPPGSPPRKTLASCLMPGWLVSSALRSVSSSTWRLITPTPKLRVAVCCSPSVTANSDEVIRVGILFFLLIYSFIVFVTLCPQKDRVVDTYKVQKQSLTYVGAGHADVPRRPGCHDQHQPPAHDGEGDGLVVPVELAQQQPVGEGGEEDAHPDPAPGRVAQQRGRELDPGAGLHGEGAARPAPARWGGGRGQGRGCCCWCGAANPQHRGICNNSSRYEVCSSQHHHNPDITCQFGFLYNPTNSCGHNRRPIKQSLPSYTLQLTHSVTIYHNFQRYTVFTHHQHYSTHNQYSLLSQR